jgi:hypothetical protein
VTDIDAALREVRRDEPVIDTVEKGLQAAKAARVPVDLEGVKPPPSALAVTRTGVRAGGGAREEAGAAAKAGAEGEPAGQGSREAGEGRRSRPGRCRTGALRGPLVERRGDVDRGHLVIGAEKTVNRRGADLPASTRDQDAHGVVPSRA